METGSVPPNGQALRVVLYTGNRILRGALYQRARIRLSDQMNMLDEDFLELHQEQSTDPASGEAGGQTPGSWFVARGEILMVHEDVVAQDQVMSRGGGDRVEKRAVAVRCFVGPFQVEGQFYMVDFSSMATSLNRCSVPFVPLTAARITVPGRPGASPVQTPFVLVNRARLVISGEGGPSGSPSAGL